MRRNLENTNALAQASYKEIMEIKKYLSKIDARLDAISTQVDNSTFQTLMSGSSDLSEFFPVENKEQLANFMNRQHPEWESRKTEFYNYLFTITTKNRGGFARGLIKALFSRKYISKNKWPSSGYEAKV